MQSQYEAVRAKLTAKRQKREDPPPLVHVAALPRLSTKRGGEWDGKATDEAGKRLITDKGAYCRLRQRRPQDLFECSACIGDERAAVPQCPDLVRCSMNAPLDESERYAQDQLSSAHFGGAYQGWRVRPNMELIRG